MDVHPMNPMFIQLKLINNWPIPISTSDVFFFHPASPGRISMQQGAQQRHLVDMLCHGEIETSTMETRNKATKAWN